MVDADRYFEIDRDKSGTAHVDPERREILQRYNSTEKTDALICPVNENGSGQLRVVRNKVGDLWYYCVDLHVRSLWPENLKRFRKCTDEECKAIHTLCIVGKLFDIRGPCGCNLVVREHPRPG